MKNRILLTHKTLKGSFPLLARPVGQDEYHIISLSQYQKAKKALGLSEKQKPKLHVITKSSGIREVDVLDNGNTWGYIT